MKTCVLLILWGVLQLFGFVCFELTCIMYRLCIFTRASHSLLSLSAFAQCCFNAGPTLKQHWINASCFLVNLANLRKWGYAAYQTATKHWTNVASMLAAVYDLGPTLTQHWFNVSCFAGLPDCDERKVTGYVGCAVFNAVSSTTTNSSNWSLFKWAVTAVCLCWAVQRRGVCGVAVKPSHPRTRSQACLVHRKKTSYIQPDSQANP